ncbi:MAG: flagellar export protein FliJ [Bacillota bacterium]|nr:flagellar export protein FliJ [Bacillota bacterium]
MKRFVFSLQTVLELKRRREEALLEELAKRTRAAAAAEERLKELRAERRRAQGELRQLLRGRLEVERVRSAQDYLAGLDERIERQRVEVRRRNEEVKACRQQVVAASQERKAFEKLRERQWEAYQKEYQRQEQVFLDEIATQEYARQER